MPRQLDQLLLRGIEMSGSALRFTGAVRFCVGERLRSCAGERLRGAAREGLMETLRGDDDIVKVSSPKSQFPKSCNSSVRLEAHNHEENRSTVEMHITH